MKSNRVSKQIHRKSKSFDHTVSYSREICRITCSVSAIKSDNKNKMTTLKGEDMIRQSSISLNQHRNLQCFIHSDSFWSEVLAMESEVCNLLLTRTSVSSFTLMLFHNLSLKSMVQNRISRSLMVFLKKR